MGKGYCAEKHHKRNGCMGWGPSQVWTHKGEGGMGEAGYWGSTGLVGTWSAKPFFKITLPYFFPRSLCHMLSPTETPGPG